MIPTPGVGVADVGSEESDIGLVALVGAVTETTGGVEAMAGDEVDGTGGDLEVAANVGDQGGDSNAVSAETAPGGGDVDRDVRPNLRSINFPPSITRRLLFFPSSVL